MVTALKTGVNC